MMLKELLDILLDGLQDQAWTLNSDVTLLVECEDREIIIGELSSISGNETLYFDNDGNEHKTPDGVSLYAEYEQ